MLVKDLYYEKYLKYKNKYLNLQSQLVGGRYTIDEGIGSTHELKSIKLPIVKDSKILEADEIEKFVYFKNLELKESKEVIQETKDDIFFNDSDDYNITVIYSSTYNVINQSRDFTIKFRVTNKKGPDDEYEYDDETWETSYGGILNTMKTRTCNITKFFDTTTEIDTSFYKITVTYSSDSSDSSDSSVSSVELLSTNHELLQKYVELKKPL